MTSSERKQIQIQTWAGQRDPPFPVTLWLPAVWRWPGGPGPCPAGALSCSSWCDSEIWAASKKTQLKKKNKQKSSINNSWQRRLHNLTIVTVC